LTTRIDVHGSFRYKNTYDVAVDLLTDGVVDVEGLVDFESPLEDVDDAFQRAMEPASSRG